MRVTAVFDIGKTNKKFILFDEDFGEVFSESKRFDEIEDDDGYPCENLEAIRKWIMDVLAGALKNENYDVRAVNFSAYGASLVHIDASGCVVTPMYNYLKPLPEDVLQSFNKKHGNQSTIAMDTASPPLGMLNAGMQLYWLKHAKPERFQRIRWSLFLPQYLSWLFTGIAVNDYTCIGCHTSLWDFTKGDYHRWVHAEGMDRIMPPIVKSNSGVIGTIHGKRLTIGVGIHDSSSALLPYLQTHNEQFVVVSTGTWSISLNPFSKQPLNEDDLRNDCLNYMSIDGEPVRASRLFLGNEHDLQLARLEAHFNKSDSHHSELFDEAIYRRLKEDHQHHFRFESIISGRVQPTAPSLDVFETFEEAYYQLMMELVELQVQAIEQAIGNTAVSTLYVDGGFAGNPIFVELLMKHFGAMQISATQSSAGSALGAAIVISDQQEKIYRLDEILKPKASRKERRDWIAENQKGHDI